MRPAVLLVLAAACTAQPPSTADEVRRIADDVVPRVERAVGLTFRTPPVFGVRSQAQLEGYLIARLDAEYPPERLANLVAAYRRFGLVPDTLDLRALLLAVLGEQVLGYFDPDSATLYVVERSDPVAIRLVLAHELVHALQAQYLPLDSILTSAGPSDPRLAAQAVLEGQAHYSSLLALPEAEPLLRQGTFWGEMRALARQQYDQMPAFASAPLAIREELLFPYLAGADFMRWFQETMPDTQPYGPRLPRSTEQILHPEKYRAGDEPTTVVLSHRGAGVPLYEDGFGEFETRIVLQELTGSESLGTAGALGWDGDRFAVYPGPRNGEPIVWWSVWDSPAAAEKFATMLERHWPGRVPPGRRWQVDRAPVDGMPGVRLVDAGDDWQGWARLPEARTR